MSTESMSKFLIKIQFMLPHFGSIPLLLSLFFISSSIHLYSIFSAYYGNSLFINLNFIINHVTNNNEIIL